MALDFPASPTLNQVFTSGNTTWIYDGTAWNITPQMTPAVASDLPPANPAIGQLWWRASNGIMYIYFDDGNTKQWVQTSPGGAVPAKIARTRNRVNNPTMQVSQENGNTPVAASGLYPADQWQLQCGGIASNAYRASPFTSSSPEGTVTAAAIYASTAKPSLVAGDFLLLIQPIEGIDIADFLWGTVNAKSVVLRFSAYADTAGTYAFTIRNATANRSYVGSFTITTGGVWQSFSFAVPGDTTGVWPKDNSVGLTLGFTAAAGSTYIAPAAGWNAGNFVAPSGISNGAAVINQGLYITDVGLHLDPDKTGLAPPFNPPPYEDDLIRCMRYWFSWGSMILFVTYANGAVQMLSVYTFPVVMRTAPTVGYVNVTYQNCNTLTTNGVGDRFINVQAQATVAGAAYAGWGAKLNARLA
jgi:hypothetical protein